MPNQHPRASTRHHTSSGFRNPEADAREASPLEVAQWLAGRVMNGKRNVPPHTQPVTDLTAPATPLRVTWVGHAATIIQTSSLTILTDPHFGPRASPVSFAGPERLTRLPLTVADLPPVDLVVLSHDHYDHLDRGSIEQIEAIHAPLFLAPLGCADRLRDWGVASVQAFDWWEYEDLDLSDGLRVHALPAQHFSGRTLLDRNATLWASWLLETDDISVYFGGDSGYGRHFSDIHDALGPTDVALLPIGAYEPRSIMAPVHMSPEEAVQAAVDLGRPHVVPIHWGTFDLANEPVQAPAPAAMRAAERHGLGNHIHPLRPGESMELET
jgi:N-acyl-phosphatidylethanolamine-hydrolysing phospholipase D